MAKKQATKSSKKSGGKLAGQTVGFVGKFGYNDSFRNNYAELVRVSGGVVVDWNRESPDYLWVGEGRGGKPPADVTKIQKKHPAVNVLGTNDFFQLLVPDADTLLSVLKKRKDSQDPAWKAFEELASTTKLQVVVSKADLRNTFLKYANLEF